MCVNMVKITSLNFLKIFWELLWLYFEQNKKFATLELKNVELEAPSPISFQHLLFIHKETEPWRVYAVFKVTEWGLEPRSPASQPAVFSLQYNSSYGIFLSFVWYLTFQVSTQKPLIQWIWE